MSYGGMGSSTGQSSSSSSGESTSSSTPTVIQTPQSQAELRIAELAAQLGGQVFQWAQGVFAQTSALTDQMVNNFIATSQQGLQLASMQLDEYSKVGLPEMNQLAQMAGQYNSSARQQLNAGAAEQTAGLAGNANMQNTLANLRSYGVDPSSGMYGDILASQGTGIGAAEAGAGNQAILNTANTGRQLLGQSIAAQQQLPGDTVNALNSAYQGISGAENSILSNANVGATLQDASAPFYNAAMALKYPPVGQTTTAQSKQGSVSMGGGGGGKGNQQKQQQPQGYGGYGNRGQGAPKTGPLNTPGLASNLSDQMGGSNPFNQGGNGGFDPNTPNSGGFDEAGFQQAFGAAQQQAAQTQGGFDEAGFQSAFSGNYGGASGGDNPFGPFQGGGSNIGNYGGASGGDNPFLGGDSSFGSGQFGSGFDPNSGFSTPDAGTGMEQGSGSGMGGGSYSNQGGYGGGYGGASNQGGYTQQNTTSTGMEQGSYGGYSGGYGGGYGGGGGYAKGGVIGGGRMVPRQASPSFGARTDDVRANLNAGEFVIPKDVAAWKGGEFFQNLIDKSRKARMMGTAQGKPTPPGQASGPAQFSTAGAP